MEQLILTPVTQADINCFDGTEYQNLTLARKKELISNSITGVCDGKFFKFYLLKDNDKTVGVFNFYEQSKSVISICPNIKEEYRKNGYATKGLILAHAVAKEKGYSVALQTVREENLASIGLHQKLGFELVKKCKTQNGNPVRIYLKLL